MDTALLQMSHCSRITLRCTSLVKLLFRQLFDCVMLYSCPDISKSGSHFRSCSCSSLVKISATGIVAACSLVSISVAKSRIIYQKDYFLILLKESSVAVVIEKKISTQKPVSSWNIWRQTEVKSDSIILRQPVHITLVPLCSIYVLCNSEMPLGFFFATCSWC